MCRFAGIHRHDLRRDLVHLALQVVEVGLELRLVPSLPLT